MFWNIAKSEIRSKMKYTPSLGRIVHEGSSHIRDHIVIIHHGERGVSRDV